jgi:hypothetical protein
MTTAEAREIVDRLLIEMSRGRYSTTEEREALTLILSEHEKMSEMLLCAESVRIRHSFASPRFSMLRNYIGGGWRVNEGDDEFASALAAYQALKEKL